MKERKPYSLFGKSFFISCIVVGIALLIAVGAMAIHSAQVMKERAEKEKSEPELIQVSIVQEPKTDPLEEEQPVEEQETISDPESSPAEITVQKVERIAIRYYDEEKSEFTMHVGDKLTVNAYILPAAASGAEVSWICSNENGNYLAIEQDEENPLLCTVECIAALSGGVKLTVKADGQEASCQIYLIP